MEYLAFRYPDKYKIRFKRTYKNVEIRLLHYQKDDLGYFSNLIDNITLEYANYRRWKWMK